MTPSFPHFFAVLGIQIVFIHRRDECFTIQTQRHPGTRSIDLVEDVDVNDLEQEHIFGHIAASFALR